MNGEVTYSMQKHIIFSLGATVLWGFWAVLVKLSASRTGHWQTVMIYTLFSTLTIAALFVVRGESLRNPDTLGVIFAAAAGILGGLAVISYHKAVASGPVSTSTAISALYPVIAVIFGMTVLREQPSATGIIGIILAVAGGVLISL